MTIPRRKPYFFTKNIFEIFNVLKSKTKKDEVAKLEQDLQKILKLPNPVVVGQGRIGLTLILKESGIKKGSEIIMPGYTFGTLTHIIKKAGFNPIPVDIDPQTYEMSPTEVERSINKKTGAILATHLFGEPCDIVAIKKIADKNKLFLIEDCAQSLGTTSSGKLVGTFGNAAFSSFDISKPLQGIRGGVVFSSDKKLIAKIRKQVLNNKIQTKNAVDEAKKGLFGFILNQSPIWPLAAYLFGFKSLQKKFVEIYRKNETHKVAYNLPPVFAKIVRQNLENFKERLATRRGLRNQYTKYLSKILEFPKISKTNKGSVYLLPVKINADIFKLRRYLALRGVDIALADEVADDCLKLAGSNISKVYEKTFTLPIYESLTEKNIKLISRMIKRFISNK